MKEVLSYYFCSEDYKEVEKILSPFYIFDDIFGFGDVETKNNWLKVGEIFARYIQFGVGSEMDVRD